MFCLFAISCGGGDDDDPTPEPTPEPINLAPSVVQTLIYPSANLLCINEIIDFDWSDATDPENDAIKYQLTIASNRSLTQIVEQQTVSSSQRTITMQKGVPFYWNVIAIDSKNNKSLPSTTQAFYTNGIGISNFAPFTATLISPEHKSSINAGTIVLSWNGSDANIDDVLSFDLYFGEFSDPPLFQSGLLIKTLDVTVETGKTYYWKVNIIDNSEAKTIGQVWGFTIN